MKKLLLRSILVIVGILIGGAVGGYVIFHRYARDYALVRAFAMAGIFSAVSKNEYEKNTSDAKRELIVQLKIWTDGIDSSATDPIMKNALRMNRGLTEARLSILENEAGDPEQQNPTCRRPEKILRRLDGLIIRKRTSCK